jgi:hypothetical protein
MVNKENKKKLIMILILNFLTNKKAENQLENIQCF